MNADIRTEKVGTKWHAYLAGRPDVDQTALTEEAARRMVEQLRDRFGPCGAATQRFGGRTCELVRGHCAPGGKRTLHRSADATWADAPSGGGGVEHVARLRDRR